MNVPAEKDALANEKDARAMHDLIKQRDAALLKIGDLILKITLAKSDAAKQAALG